MAVPLASWQNERAPDADACCTAALISPLRVACRLDLAVARSDDEMVMPLEAANCSANRSPTWLLSTALVNVMEYVPGPPVPWPELDANWGFCSCRRQPPAVVVSRVRSWVLRAEVEMVAPLAEAAGGVMSQAEVSTPVATTAIATTVPVSWRFTAAMLVVAGGLEPPASRSPDRSGPRVRSGRPARGSAVP